MELPVEGYPISDEAVTGWFLRRHGRLPGALEVGWIMDAMARREATPPIESPLPEGVITPGPVTNGKNISGSNRQRLLLVGAGVLAGFGVLALLVGGDAWILHRWDEGQAVRPQAAVRDQATAPSPGQTATAVTPGRVGRADVPFERTATPPTAQSEGASQPKPPSGSPAPTGHWQSAMPEAAPPLPATQTPAPQPAPREQQAGASPSIPESSSAQSSASEQTATVQTPAAPSVPTQQQPGTSQGSSAPSGDAAEREAAQPKPSVALLVGPDKIIRVQQALQSRGLYRGPIDGLIGRKTEAALKAFQRNAGLAENGRIDTATLGRLLGGAA